jgi:lipopolysaccharide biosynthesis glycosyltransferase
MARLLPRSFSGGLGLFIKSTLRDLQPFLSLQDDLIEFSRIKGPVVVSVPHEHLAAFRKRVVPEYELVSDSAVARSANIVWPICNNWYSQQLVKLCATDLVAAEEFLVLDSNTIINAEFSEATFQYEGKWIYVVGDANEHDLKLERRTWTFLRLPLQQTLGFRPVNQVFIRSELMGLRRYLESTYGAPWGEILYGSCDCATRVKSALWTEFQMYGGYVAAVSQSRAHALVTNNSIAYFNPKVHLANLPQLLAWFTEHRPFMVKAYRQRPGLRLSEQEYRAVAGAIRSACRGGSIS